MELWIRSNDGVLFEKAEMIKVANIQDKGCNGKLTNFRYGIVVNNDYVFAEYKSKERALEVLDEIQDLFITRELKTEFTKDGLTIMKEQPSSVVYKMPEE